VAAARAAEARAVAEVREAEAKIAETRANEVRATETRRAAEARVVAAQAEAEKRANEVRAAEAFAAEARAAESNATQARLSAEAIVEAERLAVEEERRAAEAREAEAREAEERLLAAARKAEEREARKLSSKLWTVGASIGTSFAAPMFIISAHGTVAPFYFSFLEIGIDFGFLSGTSDVDYNSICPFVHYAFFLPVTRRTGWYIGAGFGYMMSNYSLPEGDLKEKTFALDMITGVNIANVFDISYTLRTNFNNSNNKISAGYTYRFKPK
jgi:hypothetical protein